MTERSLGNVIYPVDVFQKIRFSDWRIGIVTRVPQICRNATSQIPRSSLEPLNLLDQGIAQLYCSISRTLKTLVSPLISQLSLSNLLRIMLDGVRKESLFFWTTKRKLFLSVAFSEWHARRRLILRLLHK